MGQSGILSTDLVLRILSDTRHPKEIAKEHGINYNHVYNIRAGRTYAKITAPYRVSRDETRVQLLAVGLAKLPCKPTGVQDEV